MTAIVVDRLSKSFRVRPPSARGVLAALLRPEPATDVPAVRDLSFAIGRGERVAFIGPNGAGKSTTLKMLTGILHPTSGHAAVAGFVPWRQRRQLAHRIGIVFGQRSQLWYHLPVRGSFDLLRRIYDVDRAAAAARLARLAAIFDIGGFLDRPVAELSLGQRIRCEIAAALLHAPAVLLLDEPTIGLDVTAKSALRDHLTALARDEGTTVLLTSHDTGDIEKICDRVIVIDHGRLLLDEPLERLRRDFMQRRAVVLITAEEKPALDMPGVAVSTAEPYRLTLSVDTAISPVERVVGAALLRLTVQDLVIENPPLEDIVKAIYRGDGSMEQRHVPG
ncbi:MAG: ATP-binding cassette domain-containing protein [Proteobacteria bacterium]|nr:ATP-binding cassette domain-containing protein [Pseudomonadota bacterium]